MVGPYYVLNGELRPIAEATVAVDDINFAYGFGVYETLKLRAGVVYFPERHADRLLHSAEIISLEHPFTREQIETAIRDLAHANGLQDANIKMLLIGSPNVDDGSLSHLYVFMLNPLFPPREVYRDGAAVITFCGERRYPRSKSLDMLTSTLAYRAARRAGAYDALLVDREERITEGTRTNLFYTDGTTVFHPPDKTALLGVTKLTLKETLLGHDFEVRERPLARKEIGEWAGFFVTSTSSKVIPVSHIDETHFDIPEVTRAIMAVYDRFLEEYRASQQRAIP